MEELLKELRKIVAAENAHTTVTNSENQITLSGRPSSTVLKITGKGEEQFHLEEIRATGGFRKSIAIVPPRWANNGKSFSRFALLHNVRRWLTEQRAFGGMQ